MWFVYSDCGTRSCVWSPIAHQGTRAASNNNTNTSKTRWNICHLSFVMFVVHAYLTNRINYKYRSHEIALIRANVRYSQSSLLHYSGSFVGFSACIVLRMNATRWSLVSVERQNSLNRSICCESNLITMSKLSPLYFSRIGSSNFGLNFFFWSFATSIPFRIDFALFPLRGIRNEIQKSQSDLSCVEFSFEPTFPIVYSVTCLVHTVKYTVNITHCARIW